MPYATNEGARLYYEVHGDVTRKARPWVVLVHGGGGNAASWWQQIPRLTLDRRVIVFDQRGFARSPCADELQDPRYLANDLFAIMDDADVDRASIVCQSLGGSTGTQAAVQAPARVSGVVMANTVAGIGTLAVVDNLNRMSERMAQARWPMPFSKPFARTSESLAFLYWQLASHNTHALMTRPNGLVLNELTWPTPAQILASGVPFAMLAGEHDVMAPADFLASVATAIGAQFHDVRGVGHSTYYEQPEQFLDLVCPLLEQWEAAG